jgi:hypothetical protein
MPVDLDRMRAYVAELRKQAGQAPGAKRIEMENTARLVTTLIEGIVASRQRDDWAKKSWKFQTCQFD